MSEGSRLSNSTRELDCKSFERSVCLFASRGIERMKVCTSFLAQAHCLLQKWLPTIPNIHLVVIPTILVNLNLLENFEVIFGLIGRYTLKN